MKIRIYFLGDDNVSRKEKKQIKNNVRECIVELYKKKKPIQDLRQIPVIPESKWVIYSENGMDRQEIDHLFPKKICKQTNYLLGKTVISRKDVLYLIDVDELFFMTDQYYIWPSDERKKMYIKIN